MLIFGVIICLILYLFIEALVKDMQRHSQFDGFYNASARNVSLSSLIPDTVLESWIAEPPQSTAWKAPNPEGEDDPSSHSSFDDNNSTTTPETNSKESLLFDPTPAEVQSDDSSVPSLPSKRYYMESLFDPPSVEVEADWGVVLGTFDHYDDENWKDFLIKTEVPLLIRMFLSDSSESVTLSRSLKKESQKEDTKLDKKTKKSSKASERPGSSSSDYEVLIATSSWLLTHRSEFRLGQTYIEHDLDGTDSKNTFFFSSPRLLIHNKIKDKWRTAIVRHFSETGLNMTFIDRDRMLVARRFFHRIE